MFKAILTKDSDEQKLAFFIAKLFLIWLSWKGVIFVLGEESLPITERLFPQISGYWESFNLLLVRFIVEQSANVLNLIGYESYTYHRMVWVVDANGIVIGNYCIGIQLIYYYTLLLFVTPMSGIKKAIAIPVGVIITFILNIIRISSLCLVALYAPHYLNLAHDHIFNIVVFGTLLGFYFWLIKEKHKSKGLNKDIEMP
jgi:exosortase/archaeosortase family protein